MTTLATLAAFVRRDWLVARSYRFRLVMQFAAQIFQLATFFFVSKMVNPTAASGVDGRDGYFGYVAIGIILLGLAGAGLSTFAVRIEAERLGGSLEAMLTTPTSPAVLVIGTAAYGLCSAVVSAVTMLAMAVVLFGFTLDPTPGTAVVAVAALLATVLWVAALGVLVAAFALVVQRGAVILQFTAAALPLFGGGVLHGRDPAGAAGDDRPFVPLRLGAGRHPGVAGGGADRPGKGRAARAGGGADAAAGAVGLRDGAAACPADGDAVAVLARPVRGDGEIDPPARTR